MGTRIPVCNHICSLQFRIRVQGLAHTEIISIIMLLKFIENICLRCLNRYKTAVYFQANSGDSQPFNPSWHGFSCYLTSKIFF